SARLWDLATGRPLGAPVANPGAVTAVALGARGATFLTGCDGASVRLWKRSPGEPVTIQPAPPGVKTYAVAYSPDGGTLLTAGLTAIVMPGNQATSTLQRLDSRTGAPVGPPLVVAGLARAVAFHPQGNTVLVGGCEADLRTARSWAQEFDMA